MLGQLIRDDLPQRPGDLRVYTAATTGATTRGTRRGSRSWKVKGHTDIEEELARRVEVAAHYLRDGPAQLTEGCSGRQ